MCLALGVGLYAMVRTHASPVTDEDTALLCVFGLAVALLCVFGLAVAGTGRVVRECCARVLEMFDQYPEQPAMFVTQHGVIPIMQMLEVRSQAALPRYD